MNTGSITDFVTWIGTGVSVFAAVFSLIQARNARKSKNDAEKLKNYLIEKYTNYNDSQLRTKIIIILDQICRNRAKSFSQNPLAKKGKLYTELSALLIEIRSQKIYEIEIITENINRCEAILSNFDEVKYSDQMSDIIGSLTNIARHIDVSIRRENHE